jgi:hypothetical protein
LLWQSAILTAPIVRARPETGRDDRVVAYEGLFTLEWCEPVASGPRPL